MQPALPAGVVSVAENERGVVAGVEDRDSCSAGLLRNCCNLPLGVVSNLLPEWSWLNASMARGKELE